MEDPAIILFKIMLKKAKTEKERAEIQAAIDELEAEKWECSA